MDGSNTSVAFALTCRDSPSYGTGAVLIGVSPTSGKRWWTVRHPGARGAQVQGLGPGFLVAYGNPDATDAPPLDAAVDAGGGDEYWDVTEPAGYPLPGIPKTLYLGPGDLLTWIDIDTGKMLSSKHVPALAGRTTVDATWLGKVAVALLRDGTPAGSDTRAGLHVIVLAVDNGAVTADAAVPVAPVSCGTDLARGRALAFAARPLPCVSDTATLAVGDGLAIVATRATAAARTGELVAFG
jgi:hypothetical protein